MECLEIFGSRQCHVWAGGPGSLSRKPGIAEPEARDR